jgi:hypothetical protein
MMENNTVVEDLAAVDNTVSGASTEDSHHDIERTTASPKPSKDEDQADDGSSAHDGTATVAALIGSICYTIGSFGFIWSSWDPEDWLIPFQFGCGVWIVGCVAFGIAIGLEAHGCRRHSTKWWQTVCTVCHSTCQLTFLVGCGLAFGGNEDEIAERVSIGNALFLAGSLALVIDVVLVYLHSPRKKEDFFVARAAAPINILVVISFVYAAVVGGYGGTTATLRAGMFGWVIGSVASGVLPTKELLSRKQNRNSNTILTDEAAADNTERTSGTQLMCR